MVKKRNAMRTNLTRSIKKSLGRYIAIAMIIALGACIFVGLKMTKTDMVATGQTYTDAQNLFDLRLASSYGWGREQVEEVRQIPGLSEVEGIFYADYIVGRADGEDAVFRFYTIPKTIDKLVLLEGRWPENAGECLLNGFHATSADIGTEIVISDANEEDSLESLTQKTFTVVGLVSSPLYMDMNLGSTSVGGGSIDNVVFVPEEAVDADYYTEIHVTLPGDYKIYTKAYNDAMDAAAEKLEPEIQPLAQERLQKVRQEAEDSYQDGWEEYQDGAKTYYDGVHEAYDELRDAYWKLKNGEQEIADNEKSLKDGELQLQMGRIQLLQGKITLENSKKALNDGKTKAITEISAAMEEMTQQLQSLADDAQTIALELTQVSTELAEVDLQIQQIESPLQMMDSSIALLDAQIENTQIQIENVENLLLENPEDPVLLLQLAGLKASLESAQANRSDLVTQRDEYVKANQDALDGLYARKTELEAQKADLEWEKNQLEDEVSGLEAMIQDSSSQLSDMLAQFLAAENQIKAGEAQIAASEATLDMNEKKIELGWEELEKAKQEIADGWKEYEDGKAEAEKELREGRQELDEARLELQDARETIDGMTENTLHILDRNTNIGYASLDSSSDIVEGVSRVFPAFFLLVAALVCITTMTRMVDEERTQIGTLKALGYSNAAIVSKYLFYAGSSAILGCGLGVVAGSVVFPIILWEAYKIMLFVQDSIVLTFDLPLCFAVIFMYTAVELGVTWYCCHHTLKEVPAELIRPKAPTAGKSLIFEKFRLWNKVSFLNKVTIRNIFRYHQRLAMMLVGIGGCTALLLTGFGLRDSIMHIVDFQFEDVTTYDMEVYFTKGQTEADQARFERKVAPYAQDVLFFHQSSVELSFEENLQEIYLLSAGNDLTNFIDLHDRYSQVSLPGRGEVVLSSGVAKAMGVRAGDRVTLRDPDMRTLELTVSGVYYNYVYNYAIVSPETIAEAWGQEPELQMAYVRTAEGRDVHEVSAQVSGLQDVMNVSVSEDEADMVRNMMDALNLVVVVIVFCAALLAGTVLYNLTNININERIREIATIKVLGFNALETALYIFKENLSLSVMGTLIGMLFGKLLLDFVMSQIKINMVWFLGRALPMSYVLSVVITLAMAVIVDFVFYFRLEKINMAEALKSVE